MATKKPPSKSSSSKMSSKKPSRASSAAGASRSTVSGPSKSDAAADDALTGKLQGTEELAAAMPFNPTKPAEYGNAANVPPQGATAEPPHATVTGSTLTEANASPKAGEDAPRLGFNPANTPLDRVKVDSSARPLTTNMGVAVADNQNSLKAGLRGPTR